MSTKRQALHLILKIIEKGLDAAESIDMQLYLIESRERTLKKLSNEHEFLEPRNRSQA